MRFYCILSEGSQISSFAFLCFIVFVSIKIDIIFANSPTLMRVWGGPRGGGG